MSDQIFQILEAHDGIEISGPSGSISVIAEPTEQRSDVHIGDPGSHDSISGGNLCPVYGDTYKHKDKIKKLPRGDGGTNWNGEVWTVNASKTTKLASVLCLAAVTVSLTQGAINSDDRWGMFVDEGSSKKPDKDDSPDDTEQSGIKVIAGPEDIPGAMSESWAEQAVEVSSNVSTIEELADNMELDLLSDKEALSEVDDIDDVGVLEVIEGF